MTSSSPEIYYLPSGCNCDGTNYTQANISAACDEALSLASQGKTLGRDKYPHTYNDYEKFQFSHAAKPYLEFPVVQSGTYDGASPGADRIVIGSIAEDYSSAVYCAVLTHDESSNNGFTECSDDTMNVTNGKGKYEPQEGEHEKRGRHHGRKLLQEIHLK